MIGVKDAASILPYLSERCTQHFAGADETKVSSTWKGYLSPLSFAVVLLRKANTRAS
jgi:hypothetical protein